jgi:hypothetical protein
MNKGYSWADKQRLQRFTVIAKRHIPTSERAGYECLTCGRVFTRKHVRWVGDGWICRDRCERRNRSAS